MRSYHALAWRQYELLQLGRVSEAAALLDEIEPVVKATGDLTLLSDLASMRARQVVESAQWERLARERNFANVNELCAIGFSAARSGNPALAEMARAGLAGRATAPEEGALRPAIAIMERQVAGLIALAGGRGDEAVQILRAAARDELAPAATVRSADSDHPGPGTARRGPARAAASRPRPSRPSRRRWPATPTAPGRCSARPGPRRGSAMPKRRAGITRRH